MSMLSSSSCGGGSLSICLIVGNKRWQGYLQIGINIVIIQIKNRLPNQLGYGDVSNRIGDKSTLFYSPAINNRNKTTCLSLIVANR